MTLPSTGSLPAAGTLDDEALAKALEDAEDEYDRADSGRAASEVAVRIWARRIRSLENEIDARETAATEGPTPDVGPDPLDLPSYAS